MDFAALTAPISSVLWYLVPLAILAALLKSPGFKGILGEGIVNLSARLFLRHPEYRLFHDVLLPTADGSTQIDHLIVSEYGVFVVETKNMKGWIFGRSEQREWTQQIFKQKYRFQNPLRQNYKHVQAVTAHLNLREDEVHSLVVFVGDSQFKTPMPANVTYGAGYIRFIRSKRRLVLSSTRVDAIAQEITRYRLPRSRATRRAHKAHVSGKRAQLAASRVCPRCGSPLVLRTSKKGANAGSQFWGCSSFPKCRYTQDLQ